MATRAIRPLIYKRWLFIDFFFTAVLVLTYYMKKYATVYSDDFQWMLATLLGNLTGNCRKKETMTRGMIIYLYQVKATMKVNSTLDSMTSSSQVLAMLKEKKMDTEFQWTPGGFSAGKDKTYQPGELEIVKTFRFEGASDPGDSEILYIIRAKDGVIGYSQDVYGAESGHEDEEGYDNFMRLIPIAGHDEEMLFQL